MEDYFVTINPKHRVRDCYSIIAIVVKAKSRAEAIRIALVKEGMPIYPNKDYQKPCANPLEIGKVYLL